MLTCFGIELRVVRPSEPGAETKVCEFDVSVRVDEDVVGLDVAVDEAHVVDALNGAGQLGDVEPEKNNRMLFSAEEINQKVMFQFGV